MPTSNQRTALRRFTAQENLWEYKYAKECGVPLPDGLTEQFIAREAILFSLKLPKGLNKYLPYRKRPKTRRAQNNPKD
jgi:hypothetical protein